MTTVVYTAVCGADVDRLAPPDVCPPHVPHRCYTDDPTFAVNGWQMIVQPREADPVRHARRLKILSHLTEPTADVTIWIDSAYRCLSDPAEFPMPGPNRILAFIHPDRTTIMQEGAVLVTKGLATEDQIRAQVERQTREWVQTALTSTGLLIRRQASPRVRKFNRTWWDAFCEGGHTRDQMSVDYAAWLTGVTIEYLPGHYRRNDLARWQGRRR